MGGALLAHGVIDSNARIEFRAVLANTLIEPVLHHVIQGQCYIINHTFIANYTIDLLFSKWRQNIVI